MLSGLWMIGAVSWAMMTTPSWEETLYVDDELVSRAQCSLRFEQGWHAVRSTSLESFRAYWLPVSAESQWEALGIQAVHRSNTGRIVQVDTKHFQHRFSYRGAELVGIHTQDAWEEHTYEVVWRGGFPVQLAGYLERIKLDYDARGRLVHITETWLDEPEMKREVVMSGDETDNRKPLPFSMGWLFTREGKFNPEWQTAWWLSKQRYPDAVASVAQD